MTHDGSLGHAIRMAEVAAECGVDAVKFQLHDAEAETTRDAPSPPYFKHETRWEYFERTAFTDDQWGTLKAACEAAGVEFLCSAFSTKAVERLERIGVSRYKIGSGEVTNLELVRAAAATGKPVLLTSGMSSWAELDAAVAAAGDQVTVLQCTSQYPTPSERVGLNVLARAARALRQAGRLLRPHARELRGLRGGDARRDGRREALHALAATSTAPTRASRPSRSSSRTSSTASASSRRCSRTRWTRTTSSRSAR